MNKIASAVIGNYRPLGKLWFPMLMALILLAAVLMVGACSDNATEVPFPTTPPPESRDWLFTVYGTSPTDIYVAGSRGVLFHNNGTGWVRDTKVGTSKAITSIWDAGDGTLYATGHGGVIMRNSVGGLGGWGNMTTGTTKDMYGIGRFRGSIMACGFGGALMKLNGNTWGGVAGTSWILDASGAPIDTLYLNQDFSSLVTVNSYFIGGAYIDPGFAGTPVDMEGTKGGVLAVAFPSAFPEPDTATGAFKVLPDWVLRPISGEQIVDAEWMLCSTSDPDSLNRNFLGTSEGWLFQLGDAQGDTVWTKFYPSFTTRMGDGIQSLWLDEDRNIYLVTDDGQIWYQSWDYKFRESGERISLYNGPVTLTGIWGSDPSNLYVVGYMDEMLLHCSHDPISGTFDVVPDTTLIFPAEKAMDPGPTVDKFGRPLY